VDGTVTAGRALADASEMRGPSERETDKAKSRWSGWLFVGVKVALTGLALVFVLRKVDLAAAWVYAKEQQVGLAVLAVAIVVVQILCGGLRWQIILRRLGARVPLGDSFRLVYISTFFNSAGAVGGGDVVRGWLAYRSDMSLSVSVHSVLLDRISTVGGMAVLVIATAPLLVARASGHVALWVPALASAGFILGIAAVALLDWMLPSGAARFRILRPFVALSSSTRRVFLNPTTALPVLGLAAAAQVCIALAAYVLGQGLHIQLRLIDYLILMQPVIFLSALPISIGGWGVRESAMVSLLGLAGVPAAAALILSLQLGLLTIIASLPGGVMMILQRRRRATPDKPVPSSALA
jgi:glycosyltransferase 2 family protein